MRSPKVTHAAGMLCVMLGVVTLPDARAAAPMLPAFNAEIAQTSISGISAGAYMAVQFATAWSSVIKGVGAIAGGPFGCSEGSGSAALSTCMDGSPAIDLNELIGRTDAFSASGGIDNTNGLPAQKVYLFNGYNDSVVARPVTNALFAFYQHYQPAAGNIFYQTAIGAGHSQVTVGYGGRCSENGGEYINQCGYDQAGVILQHIYGALKPPAPGALAGRLMAFRQADFTAPDQPIDDSMDDTGFAYVPAACRANEPCRVHIALHGCKQSFGNIGEDFVNHAGYNQWADTNQIIVVYPQAQALGFRNPEACWDWWGYLDKDPTVSPTYLLKSGKQIRAIKAMIDRVTRSASAPAETAGTSAAPATAVSPDRTDSAVDVAWSPLPGVAAYDVFRAGPGKDGFKKIATVAGASYADVGLSPSSQYQYKIRAASADSTAGFSPVVKQTTLARVPLCGDPGNCMLHR